MSKMCSGAYILVETDIHTFTLIQLQYKYSEGKANSALRASVKGPDVASRYRGGFPEKVTTWAFT